MRPGAQQEVRSFGQQVGHVANFNFLWCSQAKGEKNPNTANLEKLGTKGEFIKALNDAFAYCDGVYAALTDAAGAQVIDITQESGRQTRNLRMGLLTLNFAHNNEIYGSMVVLSSHEGPRATSFRASDAASEQVSGVQWVII